MSASNLPPIIVKRHKGGHHGAAHGSSTWKIALADFMTAMFIIFLLLWLINQTTPEQKIGIADYFSPASVTRNSSGSGGILGGLVITAPGVLRNAGGQVGARPGGPSSPQEGEGNTEVPGYPGALEKPLGQKTEPGTRTGLKPEDVQRADELLRRLRQSIQHVPDIKGFEQNIQVEPTKEGVRIQLIDTQKQEMFPKGSAAPTPQMQEMMKAVAQVVGDLPHPLAITGHTDATPFGRRANYTNWELSADRANTSRRLLLTAGIAENRIASVTGVADREPLAPNEPAAPQNRRISIVLLNDHPVGGVPSDPPPPPPGPAPTGRLIPR